MATAYPGGVDNFTNPTASDTLNSATVPHAEQHANANDAIEAIEGELGTNPSGAYSTVKDRLDAIGTTVTAPITNAGSTVAPVIGINASSSDTANYVVQRDANQSFSIGAINFDTLSSQVSAAAKLYWDGQQTLNLGLGGGNVSIALGQEIISYVTNAEATTLAVGEVVYLYGAQGDRPTVKRASNASDTTSSKTFGIVAESIAAGGSGFVMNRGVAQKVNTAAFNPGDILWLGSTPGTFTTTKPVAPEHLVFVGVVLRSNSGNGLVFVSPQNGYELDEIHDVLLTNETDGDLLKYDGASGLWKNAAQSTLGVSYTQVSGLGTAATKDTGVAGGVATLDGAGLVPTNQLPALAITNTFVVSSQAAMLALTAQPGDVAVRTDLSKSYILTADPASTLANWQELLTPPDAVTSVDGRTGAVTLTDKYASLAAANAFTVGGHTITNAAAGVVPLTVTGAASQSADLLNVAASGGTSVFKINSTGTLLMGSGLGVAADYIISRGLTTGAYLQTSSTHMYAQARDAANIPLIAKGAASQTANLQEWQDSTPTTVAALSPFGSMALGATGYVGRLTVYTNAAATIGAVIRGAASQTANLQEWQTSAAGVVTKVEANGALAVLPASAANGYALFARSPSASVIGAIIRGAASQSANLTEWQDSTPTTKSLIDSTGAFKTSTYGNAIGLITGGSTWAGWTPVLEVRATNAAHSALNIFANGGPIFRAYDGSGNARGAWAGDGSVVVGASNTKLGTLSVYVDAAATVGAIIRGAASQTANLQEWQNSAGTAGSYITANNLFSTGKIGLNTAPSTGVMLYSVVSSATTFGAIFDGAASQSADLVQYRTSGASVLGGRNANAQIFSGSTAPITATFVATTAASGDGTTATLTTAVAHNMAVGDMVTVAGVTPTGYNGTFRVTAVPTTTSLSYANATTGAQTVAGTVSVAVQASITMRSAATVGLVVRMAGAVGSGADPIRVTNSGGSTVAYVNNYGAFYGAAFGPVNQTGGYLSTNNSSTVLVQTNVTTVVPLTVKAMASQTANLQEWQTSAGDLIAEVSPSVFRVGKNAAYPARFLVGASDLTSAISVNTHSTTEIGLAIRGVASQTANLQEWQSSGGTLIGRVSSSGVALFANVGLNTGNVYVAEENAGGFVRITKQTAAAANPSADQGKLYFRDGTNAGTLKLVVIAGATGAETTILDNIPQ